MHRHRSLIIWLTALGQLLGSVVGVGGLVLCVHLHGEMGLEPSSHRACLEALPETTVLAAEKVSGVGPR